MKGIRELKGLFPIEVGEIQIDLLPLQYLDECVLEYRSEYYNKYQDFNFGTDIKLEDLMCKVYNNIVNTILSKESNEEVRYIFLNKNKELIGGGTLYIKKSDMEISYFVKPPYQCKGIAYSCLKELIKSIDKTTLDFKGYTAEIQSLNEASINLVTKLGFKLREAKKGKYVNNYIFSLEREKR